MLRISQIKVRPGQSKEAIVRKMCDTYGIAREEIRSFQMVRESVDARKKPDIFLIYTLEVELKNASLEKKLLKKYDETRVSAQVSKPYVFPKTGEKTLSCRPVIVGTGPAGLFCGYYLALHGYRPILLERGKCATERSEDVRRFWEQGKLLTQSNVQFGEGGAGTFSDGKLNTLVKDKYGRNTEVLKTFVRFGAPQEIVYQAKPHIGTDVLVGIVTRMREEILRLGGEVRFQSKMEEILLDEERKIKAVRLEDQEVIPCEALVLATGHSARDTFRMLEKKGMPMEAKPFAVGFRVRHEQELINRSQYGGNHPLLGAAAYKLTAQTGSGRGVYSFCMCPGGYIVNASSEEGMTAVNGMSYSGRSGSYANSAIVVSVTPKDYPGEGPLQGVAFQEDLERRAYQLGKGCIPVQFYGDFEAAVRMRQDDGEESSVEQDGNAACRDLQSGYKETEDGGTDPQSDYNETEDGGTEPRSREGSEADLQAGIKGKTVYADLSTLLPKECNAAFLEGMSRFGSQIPGFDAPSVLLCGMESRTSSPVRMLRDEVSCESPLKGIYPCGEGGGYAGGITSAAMDGIRIAEAIAGKYRPLLDEK